MMELMGEILEDTGWESLDEIPVESEVPEESKTQEGEGAQTEVADADVSDVIGEDGL